MEKNPLVSEIKKAREQAYLGTYDEAIILFNSAIKQIKVMVDDPRNFKKRPDYGQMLLKVITELEYCEAMQDAINGKTSKADKIVKPPPPNNANNLYPGIRGDSPKNQRPRSPNAYPHSDKNVPNARGIPPKKAPLDTGANNIRSRTPTGGRKQPYFPDNKKTPVGGIRAKTPTQNKKPEPKKEDDAFLKHKYGKAGKGPDEELIQMLEKEVIDKAPNITFDDIAELKRAKEILFETIILPMNMPSFYKGIRKPRKGV